MERCPRRRKPHKQKGRREKEILKLVKERWLLWQAWRKAEEQEKDGLKAFWEQLKSRLANLR